MSELTQAMIKEAETEIVDKIMSGETFYRVDIASVMDGEPVEDVLIALVSGNQDIAMDLLKRQCFRFMETETGERLINLYWQDENERMSDNAIDARRYMVAEAI